MRRPLFLRASLMASFLFLSAVSGAFCLEANLYQRFSGKTVKIFVADVTDSTSAKEMDLALVKERIQTALRDRKSIQFQIVSAAQEADIVMDTQISSYVWTDHDPVDMLVGIGGTAIDAATIEDYAAIEADVTILDVRSQKPIWQDRVFATITQKPMSKAESLPLVTDNFVKAFIKECFSKRRN